MRKRGQLKLSFGMIFSIFIIIAILATAFYVISYFLNLSKCSQIGFFYQDLDDDVNKAWASDIVEETFKGSVPSKIKSVCFGDLDADNPLFAEEQKSLRKYYRRTTNNVYLYPSSEACNRESGAFNLARAETGYFFCVETDDGNIEVKLVKGSFDAKVNLEEA